MNAFSPPPRIARIVCDFWFEASHQLMRPDWPAEKNEAVFAKCTRFHGHSYQLRVTLRGPIDPETGMVLNFTDVKALVRERVLQRLDHYHLNDVLETLPTAENIAYWIAEQLVGLIGEAELTRLELWETRTSGALLEQEDLQRIQSGRGAFMTE